MSSLTSRKRIKRVQVILKIAERCNLTCSYCYYFEGGDRTFLEKPPVISEDTISELSKFLSKGVDDLELDDVWICFHGGEPFMVKPAALDRYCEIFRTELSGKCHLVLSAQTNGVHLNDALLEVINKALSRFLWNRADHALVGASHGLGGRCLSFAHSR